MANIIEVNSMEDIPIGAILESRNGNRYFYCGNKENTIWNNRGRNKYLGLLISENCLGFQTFNENMVTDTGDMDYEIVRVYKHSSNYAIENEKFNSDDLLWEKEKEIKEISIKELEEIYGCKVKIVESEEE